MELCAQRLQTHPAYPRQNRLQQKCEYPFLLWNVLSRGQATQHAPCAQRKVVLSGLKIHAGWATGTIRVAVPPGAVRPVTRSFLLLFFFFSSLHTRVKRCSAPSRPLSVPHPSADGKEPGTHLCRHQYRPNLTEWHQFKLADVMRVVSLHQ